MNKYLLISLYSSFLMMGTMTSGHANTCLDLMNNDVRTKVKEAKDSTEQFVNDTLHFTFDGRHWGGLAGYVALLLDDPKAQIRSVDESNKLDGVRCTYTVEYEEKTQTPFLMTDPQNKTECLNLMNNDVRTEVKQAIASTGAIGGKITHFTFNKQVWFGISGDIDLLESPKANIYTVSEYKREDGVLACTYMVEHGGKSFAPILMREKP